MCSCSHSQRCECDLMCPVSLWLAPVRLVQPAVLAQPPAPRLVQQRCRSWWVRVQRQVGWGWGLSQALRPVHEHLGWW